jgi:hypothetical protein
MKDQPRSEPAAPPSEGAARRAARRATPRLQRETRTMAAMLRLYCSDRHPEAARDAQGLCATCSELETYTRKRLAACPFGPDKPTCVNCQVHCYGPRQREQTRIVMRHAGPRMIWHHPVLALMHLVVDSRRTAPPKPCGKAVRKAQGDALQGRAPE